MFDVQNFLLNQTLELIDVYYGESYAFNMKERQAFTLIETMVALSIIVILLPLVSNIFYNSIRTYRKHSAKNNEIAQIIFAETYLNKICKNADLISIIGDTLHLDNAGNFHEVGVKNKKLYTRQTATRYLTVEPMLVVSHKFIKVNENYYKIELNTQTNRQYLISIFRI